MWNRPPTGWFRIWVFPSKHKIWKCPCSRLGWGFPVDWTNWTVCLFAWRWVQLTTGKYCVHFMLPPMLLSGNFYAIVFACRLQIWHLVNVLFSCKFVNTCFCAGEWMLTDHKYQNLKEKNQQWYTMNSSVLREALFNFSRWEREFIHFSLVLRDENKNSFSFVFQDKNENTCLSVSCFNWMTTKLWSVFYMVVQTWAVKLESK